MNIINVDVRLEILGHPQQIVVPKQETIALTQIALTPAFNRNRARKASKNMRPIPCTYVDQRSAKIPNG